MFSHDKEEYCIYVKLLLGEWLKLVLVGGSHKMTTKL